MDVACYACPALASMQHAMHANASTHASSDLDLIACMHADTHASIRAAWLLVDSVALQRRFTRRRHTCRWQKGKAARSRPYVQASVHAARLPLDSVVASIHAKHAGGGGRQACMQSTLASIHVHILMIALVHARTKSRSTPFLRVPSSFPPAI